MCYLAVDMYPVLPHGNTVVCLTLVTFRWITVYYLTVNMYYLTVNMYYLTVVLKLALPYPVDNHVLPHGNHILYVYLAINTMYYLTVHNHVITSL